MNEHPAEILKILCDPTRYDMLRLLFRKNAELCVKEIADKIGISHSAASHQLARLEDKGIVRCWREGQTICYAAVETPHTRALRRIIGQFEA